MGPELPSFRLRSPRAFPSLLRDNGRLLFFNCFLRGWKPCELVRIPPSDFVSPAFQTVSRVGKFRSFAADPNPIAGYCLHLFPVLT